MLVTPTNKAVMALSSFQNQTLRGAIKPKQTDRMQGNQRNSKIHSLFSFEIQNKKRLKNKDPKCVILVVAFST
jgi:hypothetical protein